MDPYKQLNIQLNPDGSLTRNEPFPRVPATGDSAPLEAVPLSKDFPLDPSKKTWVRLFLPRGVEPSQRLPIIVYTHGGGFVLYSAASSFFHDICSRLAAAVPAIVASVEFRLAPEHRLPACYDDVMDALRWVQAQAKAGEGEAAAPWLAQHGDFSRCYAMGSSSGGNAAYQVAVRAVSADLSPLCLEGVVLDQPFLGGVERTESELRNTNDPLVPLPVTDLCWELSLPEGADRDHEFANPVLHRRRTRTSSSPPLRLPRCLVRGYSGDPLVDRQKELAKMLAEEEGVSVVLRIYEGGSHGIEITDPGKLQLWVEDTVEFVKTAVGSGLPSVAAAVAAAP